MTTTTEKKEGNDGQAADSSAKKPDASEEAAKEGAGEPKEEEREQVIHLFKMAAEARDYLMPIEQWQLLRKNSEKDDRKDIEVEEIEASDMPKNTMAYESVKDKDEEEEEEEPKECIIF